MFRNFCMPLLIVALLLPCIAFAGDLEKFEEDATKQKTERAPHRHEHHADDDSGLGELLLAPFFAIFAVGGQQSFDREGGPDSPDLPAGTTPRRRPGDRLLARLRLDVAAQSIEGDISAVDVRGEGGYGPLAGQVRYTRMWDDGNNSSLTATYFHFLWRMALGSIAELDLGVGGLNLDGKHSTTGGSFTLPLQFHGSNVGVELRPAWSTLNGNVVEDYDVAAVAGLQYVALRAGYRWLLAEHESLHGPYAGMTVSW